MRRAVWFAIPLLALLSKPAHADVLADAPAKFAKTGDIKVYYKSLGDGKTAIVFVHGWCCAHDVWSEQAAALNGKARLLFLDLPGFGKSDKPKIDYTMDLFAEAVNAVLQDAGVDKAVLVGHSMGTPVVRQFYRKYPAKVQALVFVDGTLRAMIQDPAQLERFRAMFKEETFKDTAGKFITGMFKPDAPPAARKQVEELFMSTEPRVAISAMRGMTDQTIWKDDPVNVPAQALMAKSPNWTEDYKEYAKKIVPGLDYREFDGVGHFLFMEKPAEFNAALLEFLKKQGAVK